MSFFSTSNPNVRGSLLDTTLMPVPEGGGLWLPETVAAFPPEWFESLHTMTRNDIAVEVCSRLLCNELPVEVVKDIVQRMPPAPLVSLSEDTKILELFHGSTMAFKDFGAGFMAGATSHLLSTAEGKARCKRPRVLVATSGDTGGAVASAFAGTTTPVCVLFPHGRISSFQKDQICRCGPGVAAIEVQGSFDHCQRIAKAGLAKVRDTLSANSINMLRLVAQAVYYFDACRQLGPVSSWQRPVTVVVPSGNMGNGTAGVLAMRMGLPIDRLVLATNANDTVPLLMTTGEYKPKPSVATISSAMDVGDPSNFARLWSLAGGSAEKMREMVVSQSATEEETYAAMRKLHTQFGYVADPHTSVAYAVLDRLRSGGSDGGGVGVGITLSTAHPYKFADIVCQGLQGAVTEVAEPRNIREWAHPPCTMRFVGNHDAFVRILDATTVFLGAAKSNSSGNDDASDRQAIADLLCSRLYRYKRQEEAAAEQEQAAEGGVTTTFNSTVVIADGNNRIDLARAAARKRGVLVWLARGGGEGEGEEQEEEEEDAAFLMVDDPQVTNEAVAWAIAALLPAVVIA